MKRLLLRPGARMDLVRATGYYAEQGEGLGDAFREDLDATFARILENPRLYPALVPAVRRALTRRFPYKIFYVIRGSEIHVLAIRHQAQAPRPELE